VREPEERKLSGHFPAGPEGSKKKLETGCTSESSLGRRKKETIQALTTDEERSRIGGSYRGVDLVDRAKPD